MKAKKILIGLGTFLLSVFVIVYIMVQLVSSLVTDVSFEYALAEKKVDVLESTAYLIRNERVLYAESAGVTTYFVSESQKIGSNQIIATVYSSGHGVDLQNDLTRLNEQIEILENSAVDTTRLTTDVSKIDNKIYQDLIEVKRLALSGNLGLAHTYKKQIQTNFNKRRLITASENDYSAKIQTLIQKKNQLTATLQDPLCTVYAETPGYFSTLLDGYETVFTPEVLNGLTVDGFNALITRPKAASDPLAIGKVVTDFEWYILCAVDKAEAADLRAGRSYDLSLFYSASASLDGVLQKKIEQTDTDTVILQFLIEKVPQDFDYTRQQAIKIAKRTYSGLRVPRGALRIIDGQMGVYVLNGNTVKFKKIDVVFSTDSEYLSREFTSVYQSTEEYKESGKNAKEYLSRYDQIITEGKDLYVGKILD